MNISKAITPSKDTILLHLHVIPRSKKAMFPAGYNQWRNCLEVRLTSEVKDNKANQELIHIVASFFSLHIHEIKLVSGEKNREKKVALYNISQEKVAHTLQDALHAL